MLQPNGHPTLPPRKAGPRRFCQCTLHCAQRNPHTGKYEGGSWVSHATRQRHMQEDRYRRVEKRYSESKASATPTFKVLSFKDKISIIAREVAWLTSLPITSSSVHLSFIHNPRHLPHPDNEGIKLALDKTSTANATYLFVHGRYNALLADLRAIPQSDEKEETAGQIMDALEEMEKLKGFEFDQQALARDKEGRIVWSTAQHFRRKGSTLRVVRAAHVLSLVLQNIHFVPRRALRVHLRGLRGVLNSARLPSEVINEVPLDPRSCSKAFDIDPVVRQYISCPKCHCLYPFQTDNDPTTLPRCTWKQTPASKTCAAELWGQRQLTGDTFAHVPLKKYYHHELKSWVGRLLSRPGIEDLLEQPFVQSPNYGEQVNDIWGSSVVRDLKDPDGNPFLRPPNEELRLIFGLAADGFLPYNSESQNVSSTGIWLVLYNFPVNLRYLRQNVFLVGVIPGPNKPAKDELNHYTQLVVDDLKEFWGRGIFFTRTYKYRTGRSSLGILVLVLGDHPGLRQLIGYASSTNAHYLCTGCDIDIDDIHIVDKNRWPVKDGQRIRAYAEAWRTAPNESTQKALFEAHGWRWSPLFDLPYWDPAVCSVVDTMHALDLNLFKTHCRVLFGIDADHKGGDRSSALKDPYVYGGKQLPDDDSSVIKCKSLIKANPPGLLDQLLEYERPVLFKICSTYRVAEDVIGARNVLAEHLYEWRLGVEDDYPFIDEQLEEQERQASGSLQSRHSRAQLTTKYRVIRKLLSDNDAERNSARLQSSMDLHGKLCVELGIPLSDLNTKASRHAALLSAISSSEEARKKLHALLPSHTSSSQRPSADSADESDEESVEDSAISDQELPEDSQHLDPQPTLSRHEHNADTDDLADRVSRSSDPLAIKRLFKHILKIYPHGVEEAASMISSSVKVQIYEEACTLLGIPQTAPGARRKKEDINRTILDFLVTNVEVYLTLCDLFPQSEQDAVLDKYVMNRVWKDMKETQLPSWMKPAPANWGTAKRGTLSASHWQVVCTVHLPVTLIWLWRDEEETSRKTQLLTNFMHLVTASKLAYLRICTEAQITAFEYHMTCYVKGIKDLYPSHALKPTHHTAMHIGDMMRSFGPDHCRNARYYERFISFLHRMGINNKFCEMEKTFMTSAGRYSNLCSILSDDEQLHQDMTEMIQGIESIKKEDLRGFELADLLDISRIDFSSDNSAPITLQDDVASELLRLQESVGLFPASRQLFSVPQVSRGGVRYAAFQSRRYRDSSVVFRSNSVNLPITECCGFIQVILRQLCTDSNGITSDRIFMIVDEHVAISKRGIKDPYKVYGFAAGYLCDQVPRRRHVIQLADVISQFAATKIEGTDFMHVMPVDQFMYALDLGPDNRAF